MADVEMPDDIAEFFTANADDGKTLWVFHHIPKTAGSSVASEVRNLLSPSVNLGALDISAPRPTETVSPAARRDEIVDRFIETHKRSPVRFAHGHLRRNHVVKLRGIGGKVSLFTFLREPFARTVSSYRYLQTDMHPASQDFIEKYPTFDSFVEGETGEALNQRNAMCQYLVGHPNATFEEARDILENEYVFCGLLEMYPLSFRIITTLIGNPSWPAMHERKTPAKVANDIANVESYRKAVLDRNLEDLRLYRHVRNRMASDRDRYRAYLMLPARQ